MTTPARPRQTKMAAAALVTFALLAMDAATAVDSPTQRDVDSVRNKFEHDRNVTVGSHIEVVSSSAGASTSPGSASGLPPVGSASSSRPTRFDPLPVITTGSGNALPPNRLSSQSRESFQTYYVEGQCTHPTSYGQCMGFMTCCLMHRIPPPCHVLKPCGVLINTMPCVDLPPMKHLFPSPGHVVFPEDNHVHHSVHRRPPSYSGNDERDALPPRVPEPGVYPPRPMPALRPVPRPHYSEPQPEPVYPSRPQHPDSLPGSGHAKPYPERYPRPAPNPNYRLDPELYPRQPDYPRPEAEPEPYPRPLPEPYPRPVPEPYPRPVPEPYPRPVPEPYPRPVPEPYPRPVPEPYPRPVLPTPERPYPEPHPEPLPEPLYPRPDPEPYPEPVPEPSYPGSFPENPHLRHVLEPVVPHPAPEPLPEPHPEPTPEPIPLPEPNSALAPPSLPSFRCPAQHGLFPDSRDCRRYWECNGFQSRLRYCDGGQLFDRNHLCCLPAHLVTLC